MRIFVCSDTHFNHFNIIKYCNRPFHTVDEMNSYLIKQWNEIINKDDIVLFLGDFLFAKKGDAFEQTMRFESALHGQKIIVKGNHDYKNFRYCDAGFRSESYQELEIGNLYFCHNPFNIEEKTKQYRHVFYGHVHDKLLSNPPRNSTNVCLDANYFRPIDITNQFTQEEIKKLENMNLLGFMSEIF